MSHEPSAISFLALVNQTNTQIQDLTPGLPGLYSSFLVWQTKQPQFELGVPALQVL